jgi:Holliday junction DNA helicase RuvA
MIGRLRGILLEKQPPQLLLDVAGVAYEVSASMTTFYHLPAIGNEVILFTHLAVREDAHQLFGFYEQRERTLFRTLIKVNGIGPKLALAILSSISPDDFVRCVNENDTGNLVRIPGVGKKTAERLIVEMRDRLADWNNDNITVTTISVNQTAHPNINNKRISNEAISALVALGYKPQEASRAVLQIAADNLSVEDLIRLALKGMTA